MKTGLIVTVNKQLAVKSLKIFHGFNFTVVQVVYITAMMNHFFTLFCAFQIYDISSVIHPFATR